mmetsp:Transcript_3157/g.4475  ORF Transcript_3157/g.4475 Transcript_3157/m.4475 type:complete len:1125 (-) Transcript_3157:154-3528(-)
MGNGVNSKLGVFSSRSKEFQSVVPFSDTSDNISNVVEGSFKKNSVSSSKSHKTAPAPFPLEAESDTKSFQSKDTEKMTPYTSDKKNITILDSASPIDASPVETTQIESSCAAFDFQLTEGQIRRGRMADCETECSQITKDVYVGGYYVAGKLDVLQQHKITRIVNCSSAVVPNHFIEMEGMKYISLNMVDGRQDDICWFLCEVLQFIISARKSGERVLIHCEKGVSRSCSYAIAYRMWITGSSWKEAFEYVKEKRSVCAPNTAFTCNLIEIGEILSRNTSTLNLIFRCAFHLPHDAATPVLKLCRSSESRKIITPSTSLLDPKGVFLIRALREPSATSTESSQEHFLFMWCGSESSDSTADIVERLAKNMFGIITRAVAVFRVKQGEESALFKEFLLDDGPFSSETIHQWKDYFDCRPTTNIVPEDMLVAQRSFEASVSESFEKKVPFTLAIPKLSKTTELPPLNTEMDSTIDSKDSPTHLPQVNTMVEDELKLSASSVDAVTKNISASTAPNTFDGSICTSPLQVLSDTNCNIENAKLNSFEAAELDNSQKSDELRSSTHNRNIPRISTFNLTVTSNKHKDLDNSIERSNINNITVPPLKDSALFLSLPSVVTQREETTITEESGISLEINTSRIDSSDNSNTPQATTNSNGKSLPATFSLALPLQCKPTTYGSSPSDNEKPPLNRSSSSKSTLLSNRSRETLRDASSPYPSPFESSNSKPLASMSSSSASPRNALTSEATSEAEYTPHLIPSSSKTKLGLLSLAGAGIASLGVGQRPISSERERRGIFVSPRVAPQPGIPINAASADSTVTEVLTQTTTSNEKVDKSLSSSSSKSTFSHTAMSETTRLASPPSPSSSVSSATVNDSTQRGLKGMAVSLLMNSNTSIGIAEVGSNRTGSASTRAPLPNNDNFGSPIQTTTYLSRSSSKENDTSLALPLRLLQSGRLTPNSDRLPEHIGLSRGPTPVEELTPGGSKLKRDQELRSEDIFGVKKKRSESGLPVVISKPTLYQAIKSGPNKNSTQLDPNGFEWQAMGVYDEEDLIETCMLLLLSPHNQHFLWIGSEFEVEMDEDSDKAYLDWASKVAAGEVKFENLVGKHLLVNSIQIERGGSESDVFWTIFNEGC